MSNYSSKSMKPYSQSWLLLQAMLAGETLSTMEIINNFRIVRPAAVVHILRMKQDVSIETIMMKKKSSSGKNIRYARYRITPTLLQEQRERFGR